MAVKIDKRAWMSEARCKEMEGYNWEGVVQQRDSSNFAEVKFTNGDDTKLIWVHESYLSEVK